MRSLGPAQDGDESSRMLWKSPAAQRDGVLPEVGDVGETLLLVAMFVVLHL